MPSPNIFVCAYFKEGVCHADREIQRNPAMMRAVRPTVPSNLLVETGLMGRCEGVFMR